MSTTFKSYLSFEFCSDQPYGHQPIGLQIHLNWQIQATSRPALQPLIGRRHSDLLLDVDTDPWCGDEPARPFCRLRETNGHLLIFSPGRVQRFRLVSSAPGGNWHWQYYRIASPETPHALNALRRLLRAPTWNECDDEFRQLWEGRRGFAQGQLEAFLRRAFQHLLLTQPIPLQVS